jgi:hypothetical protein
MEIHGWANLHEAGERVLIDLAWQFSKMAPREP